jgi:hypothetical protein
MVISVNSPSPKKTNTKSPSGQPFRTLIRGSPRLPLRTRLLRLAGRINRFSQRIASLEPVNLTVGRRNEVSLGLVPASKAFPDHDGWRPWIASPTWVVLHSRQIRREMERRPTLAKTRNTRRQGRRGGSMTLRLIPGRKYHYHEGTQSSDLARM